MSYSTPVLDQLRSGPLGKRAMKKQRGVRLEVEFNQNRIHRKCIDFFSQDLIRIVQYHNALNNMNSNEHRHIIHIPPALPPPIHTQSAHVKTEKDKTKAQSCLMETIGTVHGGKKKRPLKPDES